GHDVHLWTSSHSRMDELAAKFAPVGPVIRAGYINTYDRRARSLGAWLDRSTPKRIAREWHELAPDVIHLNKQNLEDGLDLLAAASLSGLPAVAMIHITQTARYLNAEFASLRDAIAKCELVKFPGPLVTTPGSRENDLVEFLGDRSRV